MKRAILILAVAALGGCDTCDRPGTVAFYWRFVGAPIAGADPRFAPRGELGVPDDPRTVEDETGCAESLVDAVVLTVGGESFDIPYCASPENGVAGVLLEFTPGAADFRLDAYRGSTQTQLGDLVFSGGGTLRTDVCTDREELVDLFAVSPQPLVTFYDFEGQVPTSCTSGGQDIGNVNYWLVNPSNVTAASNCLNDRITAAGECAEAQLANLCDPVSFGFTTASLPLGRYRYAFVDATAAAPPNGVLLNACGVDVLHDGFPAFVDLAAPVGGVACTPTRF
jgi:hypothetical protein